MKRKRTIRKILGFDVWGVFADFRRGDTSVSQQHK